MMPPLEPIRIFTPPVVILLLVVLCWLRPFESLRIVLLCISFLVGYAIIQDQVTTQVSVEYFTIGHPSVLGIENPVFLGIVWGFLGGWWGGAILGVSLALTATLGRWRQLAARDLVRPLLVLIGCVGYVALIAGLSGFFAAARANLSLGEPWASAVPAARHHRFIAVVCAHFGAYATAALGGVVVCLWAGWRRRQLSHNGRSPLSHE